MKALLALTIVVTSLTAAQAPAHQGEAPTTSRPDAAFRPPLDLPDATVEMIRKVLTLIAGTVSGRR